VAQEDTIPSILHCPFALSFIIAGLAWHRLLNPTFGIVGTPPMNL
jgi:ABC-type sugar transport system permease subunit